MDKDKLLFLLGRDFLNGFRDSFAIFPAIKKINAISKSRENNYKLHQGDDQTSLARRRIEKPKHPNIEKPVDIIQKK